MNSEGQEDLMETERVIPRLEEVERNTLQIKKRQDEFEESQHKQTEKINALSDQMRTISNSQMTMENNMNRMENNMGRIENTILIDGGQTRDLLGNVVGHILKNDDNSDNREHQLAVTKLTTKEKVIIGVTASVFGVGGIASIVAALVPLFN